MAILTDLAFIEAQVFHQQAFEHAIILDFILWGFLPRDIPSLQDRGLSQLFVGYALLGLYRI